MNEINSDGDPQETKEWLEALDSVLERGGRARASFLLERLVDKARRDGAYIPYNANTAYLNTIPASREKRSPGDAELEHKIRSYDPTFGYELAVIIQDGLRRMYQEQEEVYYYITVMNENYAHPPMPEGVENGILKGMYLLREGEKRQGSIKVQLLGSGTILREVIAAAELLERDFSVSRGHLERHEFQRAAPRGIGSRALEHAASAG